MTKYYYHFEKTKESDNKTKKSMFNKLSMGFLNLLYKTQITISSFSHPPPKKNFVVVVG